ncbi:TPA: glycosyltransferase family 2 protein [Raoultella planticola]
MPMSVGIALATYNGEAYLSEMLDSIQNQTYSHFMIHVCDDGSSDDTLNIIRKHNLYLKNKIQIHLTSGGNGAMKNFRRTLSFCTEDFIALCDQDDYWVAEKLEKMILKTEGKDPKNPMLVFSDLQIVDGSLNVIHPSFFSNSSKNSLCQKPQDFVVNNHIPGCAMLFNNAAKKCFEPIPDNVKMHDWWIAFMISFFGEIVFLNDSLIKYRQHSNNTIGAPGFYRHSFLLSELSSIRHVPNALCNSRHMLTLLSESINIKKDSFQLNSDGLYFWHNINGGVSSKIKLFRKSHPGERYLMSLLVWCLL